jgi:hypothetical protein
MDELRKLDRAIFGDSVSLELVSLLDGVLERVLDLPVVTASLQPSSVEVVQTPKKREPTPELAKADDKKAVGKGAAKATKPAAKGKAAPVQDSVAEVPELPPPPPPPVVDEYKERIESIKSQVGIN